MARKRKIQIGMYKDRAGRTCYEVRVSGKRVRGGITYFSGAAAYVDGYTGGIKLSVEKTYAYF